MTTPRPDDLERDVRTLIASLGHLMHEYRWAHGVAYSRQVTDEAHVANSRRDPDGDMLRAADAGQDVDPHRSVAFDHASLRGGLTETARHVRRIMSETDAKVDMLRVRIEKDERRHGPMFDALRNPRTETRAELDERRQAQLRRRLRGEAIG